jgi:hypothetical protein
MENLMIEIKYIKTKKPLNRYQTPFIEFSSALQISSILSERIVFLIFCCKVNGDVSVKAIHVPCSVIHWEVISLRRILLKTTLTPMREEIRHDLRFSWR